MRHVIVTSRPCPGRREPPPGRPPGRPVQSADVTAPAPIPLELVLAGRELTEPRLAPDGSTVVVVQRWRGAAALIVVPAAGGPERMLATPIDPAPGRGLGGGCVAWLPDSDGVVYVGTDGELHVQPLVGGGSRLTALERSCRAPDVAADGSAVVFAVDEAEVWWVDLRAGGGRGRTEPVRLDDGSDAFCFDPVVAPDGRGVSWQAWSPPAMPWDGARRVDVRLDAGGAVLERRHWRPAGGAVQQSRFLADGTPTCVHDGTGWLNVHVGPDPVRAEPVEHAGPCWGMGQRSYAAAPDGRAVVVDRNEAGFGRLCVVDRAAGEMTTLGRGVHGQLSWVGDRIAALRTGARTPTAVVVYDVTTGERTTLAVGPAASWPVDDLPEPDLVEARDDAGVVLHARRYRAGRGRLLCWVHGGPTDQWRVDFRPRITYWWSRGWDVLVVDPRGTTGHGRRYQQALHGRWGRLDVDDTAALLRHAHRAGWAQPGTTAVIGGSSGGLTVLGVLADHAALVAGGVASAPVSDLATLADVTHRFEAHYTETLVGPAADVDRYRDHSPIGRADRIDGPLLLVHGSDDPVVPVEQSRALAEAVRAGGGDVELVVYEGEGHGIRDPEHVRDEYERTERFLARLVAS